MIVAHLSSGRQVSSIAYRLITKLDAPEADTAAAAAAVVSA